MPQRLLRWVPGGITRIVVRRDFAAGGPNRFWPADIAEQRID
jgi:hypothetical protein